MQSPITPLLCRSINTLVSSGVEASGVSALMSARALQSLTLIGHFRISGQINLSTLPAERMHGCLAVGLTRPQNHRWEGSLIHGVGKMLRL